MLGSRYAMVGRIVMAPDRETGGAAPVAPEPPPPASAGGAERAGGQGGAGIGIEAVSADSGAKPATAQPAAARPGRPSAGAPPPQQKGAAPPPPEPAAFPEAWRQALAGTDKAFLKTLERFDSPGALAKAYKELTTKLSSGELRTMKPPPVNAAPDQVAAWRAERGLPENADGYVKALKLADGMIPGEADQPLLMSFADQAMKGNWTGDQYSQAVGWYLAAQDRLAAERQQADAQFKRASLHPLQTSRKFPIVTNSFAKNVGLQALRGRGFVQQNVQQNVQQFFARCPISSPAGTTRGTSCAASRPSFRRLIGVASSSIRHASKSPVIEPVEKRRR